MLMIDRSFLLLDVQFVPHLSSSQSPKSNTIYYLIFKHTLYIIELYPFEMVKWSILVNSKFDYHEQDILASQIPRYVSL
jgi:hypothetical protein